MTLIEVMIYSSLSLMMLIGMTMIMGVMHRNMHDLIKRQDDLIQLACALTTLTRDLRELAPSKIIACRADSIIMQIKDRHCAWYLQGKRLIRAYGYYDHAAQKFTPYARSLIADTLCAFSIKTFIVRERIVGFTCTMKSAYHELSSSSAVRLCHE